MVVAVAYVRSPVGSGGSAGAVISADEAALAIVVLDIQLLCRT